jgi:hypothetical protein
LNLVGKRSFQPPPPPKEPPLHPYPSISDILVQPHVSLPHEIPTNDGWNNVVNPPQVQAHGWPTMSFPLPPPPPKCHAFHIASEVSHAHFTQPLKIFNSLAEEPEPCKGKQLANSVKSDQFEASSHSITSYSQHHGHEDGHTPFKYMHLEASTIKGKMHVKVNLQMPKVTNSKESG